MNHALIEILTGQTEKHLVLDERSQKLIHIDMQESLTDLRSAAYLNGFELQITSAFRSFEQQLAIWNAKAQGLRPLLNDQGVALNFEELSKKEVLYAILRWSALPGASRHHWGSDFDVYDSMNITSDYKVQLTPEETMGDGPFAAFHDWLDDNLEAYGFYRPYQFDKGGIAPERWHLSYGSISNEYQKHMSIDVIEELITKSDILLKEEVLSELPHIYKTYINI